MDQNRTDTGQRERDDSREAPLIPEVIDRRASQEDPEWAPGTRLGDEGSGPFAPHSFGGGRVRVYGCSPGCLLISVIVSLVLTLLLNAIF